MNFNLDEAESHLVIEQALSAAQFVSTLMGMKQFHL
jgi:hypothetical protein